MTEFAATEALGFHVAGWVHLLGGLVERHRSWWLRLAQIESRTLDLHRHTPRIQKPVYISGLPRSGTTILLEVLSRHPAVGTHQYRDYPPLYTPYWWARLLEYMETRPSVAIERSHRDRIVVTPASPEAMEEVIWMTFFPDTRDPGSSSVLGKRTANPSFESFYRAHIVKLLLARRRQRYVAKGNYNLPRLRYIQKILPDARFIVPIRRPTTHVASLMKQQRLFCEGTAANRRARVYLRRIGHFEFGPDRVPVNLGDRATAWEIMELWRRGEEVRGWARYWSHTYGFVADCLEDDPDLRAATLVVPYEELCATPADILAQVFEHAALDGGQAVADRWREQISAPTYYDPRFSAGDLTAIEDETSETAARFSFFR